MEFLPDPRQTEVLEHDRGPLLVTGPPGSGKTTVLRERFARLIESGADPERVALVVRRRKARLAARTFLLERLRASLPGLMVLTVHGLAHNVVTRRYQALGYDRPPRVLSAADQFARVRDLLAGEDSEGWPAFGGMLGLRGFANQVRQFVLRAQEALLRPEDVSAAASSRQLGGWAGLAAFYSRYLDVMNDQGEVDFAGLVVQAAAASEGGEPPFDHLMVDDYQEGTFATERLLSALAPTSLVVGGDEDSHVFSFQGTSSEPLRRFMEHVPGASRLVLETQHRSPRPVQEAWFAPHASEEQAAVARELRRINIEDGVRWGDLAIVVRREGPGLVGLLRALDDAGVPRSVAEGGFSLLNEPATFPFVLALRWLARPGERDGLVESLLTSDLAGLSPAAARGLVRAATAAGEPAAAAIGHDTGLTLGEASSVEALRGALGAAEEVADRSALDAFRVLWTGLLLGRKLVAASEDRGSLRAQRDLDAVVAFAGEVARASERSDPSVLAFLEFVEGGEEGPGLVAGPEAEPAAAVHVMTAHAAAGLEFDTVVVVGAVEGDFPSLSRPEPMFDLAVLERPISQSERNRLRLEDERRLFHVVRTRARHRVLFTASAPAGDIPELTVRSRFVGQLGVSWTPVPVAPFAQPLTVDEAAAAWRRVLADPSHPAPLRLAAVDGLLALRPRVDPERWWFQRDWTGTDRPLHENIRVSYSRLDTLENCELQFVLAQELGLESRAGYYAWVGHLVHTLIEEFDQKPRPRSLEDMVEQAKARWRAEEFPSFAVSEAFRRLVTKTILPAWFQEYGQSDSLAREARFEFEYEGATVTGFIDRIGRAGSGTQITDFKTGKSRNAAKAEENLQLGIYYLAVSMAPELAPFRPVKAVELAFLRDRDGSGVIRRSLGLTFKEEPVFRESMTERLQSLIAQIRRLLETERYRPNPKANCHFCEFKTLCPLFPEGAELFPLAGREDPVEVMA